jgi:hypothetical protein
MEATRRACSSCSTTIATDSESDRIQRTWSGELVSYTGTDTRPAVHTAKSTRVHSSRVRDRIATCAPGSSPAATKPLAMPRTRASVSAAVKVVQVSPWRWARIGRSGVRRTRSPSSRAAEPWSGATGPPWAADTGWSWAGVVVAAGVAGAVGAVGPAPAPAPGGVACLPADGVVPVAALPAVDVSVEALLRAGR